MMYKAWLLATVLMLPCATAYAEFSPQDIPQIANTSRTNDMRFARDYKGQLFEGDLPFRSVQEALLSYSVELGDHEFSGNVWCYVDKGIAQSMVDWRVGQTIHVVGTIRDTALGNVVLGDCVFSEPSRHAMTEPSSPVPFVAAPPPTVAQEPTPPNPAPPPVPFTAAPPTVVTPEAPPIGPAPASQSIEQIAATFVTQYLQAWNTDNAVAMTYFDADYAEEIDFYGKSTSHATLMDAKRKYAERWPIRKFTLRPDTLSVACDHPTSICMVSGLADWDYSSPQRGTRSTGAAQFTLKVLVQPGNTKIVGEYGSVIARQTS